MLAHEQKQLLTTVGRRWAALKKRSFGRRRRKKRKEEKRIFLSSFEGEEEEKRRRFLEKGVEEAREIYSEAKAMAEEETKRTIVKEEGEEFKTSRTRHFLETKLNLPDWEAERVAKELNRNGMDSGALFVCVNRLEKALPGVDVGRMLKNNSTIVLEIEVKRQ